MLLEIETDSTPSPAAAAPVAPPQPSKAAALSGALVQRGRERAPRFAKPVEPAFAPEPAPAPAPAEASAPPPVHDEVPLVFAKRPAKAAAAAPASRFSEALFFAACCAVFFATFLFVLRI